MCKQAALSEVGNAAARPKPRTAAGKGQRKAPGCQSSACCPSPLRSDTAFALSSWGKPGVWSSPFLLPAHRLHPPFLVIAFMEFSVYKWIQQSWLDEKIEDLSWTETLFIWGTEHQVGAASISDVWCGLGLKPVIRQAIMWLKYLEDDEAAVKPGIPTEINDCTWRCLLHQASSLEGQENPRNPATFEASQWLFLKKLKGSL